MRGLVLPQNDYSLGVDWVQVSASFPARTKETQAMASLSLSWRKSSLTIGPVAPSSLIDIKQTPESCACRGIN